MGLKANNLSRRMKGIYSALKRCGGAFFLMLTSTVWISSQIPDNSLDARAFIDSQESNTQSGTLDQKISLLKRLAPAALAAGDIEKAERFAFDLQERVGDAKRLNKNRPIDHETHVIHIVLGLAAFDRGRLAEAKEHLLAAGRLRQGSPTLNSFGPNMQLAKRLLETGERETVIKYFESCSHFWKMKGARLDEWTNTVKEGGTPDFGPNLLFQISYWKH